MPFSRLQVAEKNREQLQEKLKLAYDSEMTAEERAAAMDVMLEEEEAKQKEIDTEVRRLRDLLFKKTNELYEMKTKERNTEAEIMVGTV